LLDTQVRTTPQCGLLLAGRNYSNVHRDVAALEDLALIERDDEGRVFVPFDAIEAYIPLAKAA